MLVFKDQQDSRVEWRFLKNSFVKYKKVFAYYQPKAWRNIIIIIMKRRSTRFGGSTLILYWWRT